MQKTSPPLEDWVVNRPRGFVRQFLGRYPPDLRERAVRMVAASSDQHESGVGGDRRGCPAVASCRRRYIWVCVRPAIWTSRSSFFTTSKTPGRWCCRVSCQRTGSSTSANSSGDAQRWRSALRRPGPIPNDHSGAHCHRGRRLLGLTRRPGHVRHRGSGI